VLVTVAVTVSVPVAVVKMNVGALLIMMLMPVLWLAYYSMSSMTYLTSRSLENSVGLNICTDSDWEEVQVCGLVDVDNSSIRRRITGHLLVLQKRDILLLNLHGGNVSVGGC